MPTFIPPTIVTLTGRSGCGKTTVARRILKTHPGSRMVPSITTRDRRTDDLPDEYRYVDAYAFAEFIAHEKFLWHVCPHGTTRYGTLESSVRKACDPGSALSVMILVPERVEQLHRFARSAYGEMARIISIFLIQNDEGILRSRLESRGESEEEIERRFQKERTWFENAIGRDDLYSFVLGGDTIEELDRVVEEVLNEVDYTPCA